MVKAEAGNPSILTQPKLLFAMAANIFSQRERRRDHSHVWSQDILDAFDAWIACHIPDQKEQTRSTTAPNSVFRWKDATPITLRAALAK